MRTKLTGHGQLLKDPNRDLEFLRALSPRWFKYHQADGNRTRELLDIVPRVCLRHYDISEQFDDLARDPIGLGQAHGDYWGRVLRAEWKLTDAQIDHLSVEGLNEPPVANAEEAARVNAYGMAFAEASAQHGVRVATPCLSTGWPYNHGTGLPPDYEPFRGLVDALRRTDSYWADHEYWDGRGPDSGDWLWNPGRLMTRPDWMRGRGFKALITECGYDQAVNAPAGTPHHGWAGHIPAAEYAANHLGRYDLKMQADPDVEALMIFLLDTDNPGAWGTFDIAGCQMEILDHAAWLADQPEGGQPAPGPTEPQPEPGPTEPRRSTMRVIDKGGVTRDWAYLAGRYGAIEHLVPEGSGERLVLSEIRETEGPAVAMATVLDKAGKPLPGYQVAFSWQDAPVDLAPHGYVTKWRPRAAIQATGSNGDTGFGLGGGSYIRDLSQGGPHAMWVLNDRIPSEGLGNFGMLGGTNHEGPLRLTFQLADMVEEPEGPEEPMAVPRPSNVPADWVTGIDVSRYQGTIDWPKLTASGEIKFAVVRATIGSTETDSQWERNIVEADIAGLLTTPYHVIVATHTPKAQVDRLFAALRGRVPALPIWLDVEREDGRTPAQIADNVLAVAAEIMARGLPRPAIYTARWFWDPKVARRAEWRRFDLAVASYTTVPVMPADWSKWRFWQFTSKARLPGVTENTVDVNVFAGNLATLRVYAGQAPVPPPPPQPGDLKARLLAAGETHQVIEFNPDAALQKRIFADGFVPNSGEFSVDNYVAQRAERLGDGAVRVYYVPIGDWANVQFVTR